MENNPSIIHSLHVLGLKPGADARQVRAAFRRLARSTHPDVAGPKGTKKFEQITEAYSFLKNLSDGELAPKEAKRESFFAKWRRQKAEKKAREREARIDAIINAANKKVSEVVRKLGGYATIQK